MDWCDTCCQLILPQDRIHSLGRDYHQNCFHCAQCLRQLQPGKHLQLDQQLFCNRCCSTIMLQLTDQTKSNMITQDGQQCSISNPQQAPQINSHINSIIQKAQEYNSYYVKNANLQLKITKYNNNVLIEGALKIYWQLNSPTHRVDQHTSCTLVDLVDLDKPVQEDERLTYLPQFDSVQQVRVSSILSTNHVIALLLGRNKIINHYRHYGLFLMYHNGYSRQLKEEEIPLLMRLQVGPSDQACKIVIKDIHTNDKLERSISQEAAQFMCFSTTELENILKQYQYEEQRELEKIRTKYSQQKILIENQIQSMQTCL